MKRSALVLLLSFEFVACGGGGSSSPPSPEPPITIAVSCTPLTVNASGKVQLTATASGGNGAITVTWSASPNVGSFSPASGTSVTYTAPADAQLASSPENITITATATSGTQTGTSTVTETVDRTITIALPLPMPNDEMYSDFGMVLGVTINCTGCEDGDNLTILTPPFPAGTYPYQDHAWEIALNSTGHAYVPVTMQMQVTGTDSVSSNTLWFTFDGAENMAAEDPSTGEVFYGYTGDGSQSSFSTLKFKQDGAADGEISSVQPNGIAIDASMHEVVESYEQGVAFYDASGNVLGGTGVPNSTASVLAVSAADGLGCGTAPEIDAAFCFDLPTSQFQNVTTFSLPVPSGSQPTPIMVLNASDVVLYGRGDQTLRWYTVSGSSASKAGTLALSQFTPANAAYWKQYPSTGGWEMASVAGTLCVMGQVVNADGTVSQKLALVENANQALAQYVALPPGTVHIAADPAHNGVLAEYVDFSGTTPITRFARIDVNTGSVTTLSATSQQVPGAGFLVTNDGSQIAVFVGGKADFILNQ